MEVLLNFGVHMLAAFLEIALATCLAINLIDNVDIRVVVGLANFLIVYIASILLADWRYRTYLEKNS